MDFGAFLHRSVARLLRSLFDRCVSEATWWWWLGLI